MLANRKWAPDTLGHVLVLGLGKSGTAASAYCARLLGSRVESLTVFAGNASSQARKFARELERSGAQVVFNRFDIEGHYDVCIASPGISALSDFYQQAKAHAVEVISEVEFAWRESPTEARWVAITGTNGKTTTTALTAHLLRQAGVRAVAVGNIGDTCLDAVRAGQTDCFVAEVSSYQLASTVRFAPDVAVLLNITPDHLKWHGSFEAYCHAKKRVFANAGSNQTVVLDATNGIVLEYVRALRAKTHDVPCVIPVGTREGVFSSMVDLCGHTNAAFCDQDMLTVVRGSTTERLVKTNELQIKGEHNVLNALAASSAALVLTNRVDCLREGLATFAALEHRIEPCGTVASVRCYNDSKATNVDATLKALAAFGNERPIVLLGGEDKGTDLSDLVDGAVAHCKAIVCFGAAKDRFVAAFAGTSLPLYQASGLQEALDVALEQAQAGDIVMLSPACASFDEFSSFEDRGCHFKDWVAARRKERGA